ncbi:beta-lactamase/transpeptidase-like protein [Obba rivulosa]|uniref:Beta-lactamase/transpeptidase-like protein n=1 Tax=Obba rivulosa TaxID=1052685 RepID=A0A8E2B2J4_9APHY|nr:beta-lactamase/transpeptidase-like protein [Obba rivulosa]
MRTPRYARAISLSVVLLVGALAFCGWTASARTRHTPPSFFSQTWNAGLVKEPKEHNVHWAITPEISEHVETLRTEANIPGIAFGVVRLSDSGTPETEFGTWGVRTEDEDPVMPDTLFSIGSCSKAFVSASLGLLIDDFASGRNRTRLPPSVKKLTWDTKISSLLPVAEWGLKDPYASQKVSLRDALSHLTGMARHDLIVGPQDDALDAIPRLRFLKAQYELRQQWEYMNHMYSVVSYIISTYSGQSFVDFVTERIFRPLNMSDSTYDAVDAELSGKLSHGWTPDGRRIPYWRRHLTGDWVDGPGGIISNAIDMTKWVATLVNGGINPWINEMVIPNFVIEETTTAGAIMEGRAPAPELSLQGYGMGWMRSTYRGHEVVTHDGGIMGFNTLLGYLPWDKIGIIGFASVDGSLDTLEEVTNRIIDHILGLPPLNSSAVETLAGSRKGEKDAAMVVNRPFTSISNGESQVRVSAPVCANENATAELSVPLEMFAGSYQGLGYGSFSLCAPTSTSSYCRDVLSTFALVPSFRSTHAEPVRLSAGDASPSFASLLRPGLYGHWPRWISTHIALHPLSSSSNAPSGASTNTPASLTQVFVLSLPQLFPQGFGRNTTPFASYSAGQDGSWEAECKVVDGRVSGCGWFMRMKVDQDEDSLEERAEVWFAKVGEV